MFSESRANVIRKLLMALLFLVVAFPLRAEAACTFERDATYASPVSSALKRGINLEAWWWGNRENSFTETDFKRIRDLGLDFVRLPVSEKFLTLSDPDDQEKEIQNLRCDIVEVLKSGLAVVVSLHPSQEFKKNLEQESPQEVQARLFALWKTLGMAVEGLPESRLYLEIMNEPLWRTPDWWNVQGRIIASLRALYPKNPFIAMDVMGWYKVLDKKTPYPDKNVSYDFHFYQPLFFTHHGASWVKPTPDPRFRTDKVKYPSALETNDDPTYQQMIDYKQGAWTKEKLAEMIDAPAQWSQKYGVKVICQEFGVYRPFVDPDSRYRWIKDVREILEEKGIPWAMWNYKGSFGLIDEKGVFYHKTAEALGLNKITINGD